MGIRQNIGSRLELVITNNEDQPVVRLESTHPIVFSKSQEYMMRVEQNGSLLAVYVDNEDSLLYYASYHTQEAFKIFNSATV